MLFKRRVKEYRRRKDSCQQVEAMGLDGMGTIGARQVGRLGAPETQYWSERVEVLTKDDQGEEC